MLLSYKKFSGRLPLHFCSIHDYLKVHLRLANSYARFTCLMIGTALIQTFVKLKSRDSLEWHKYYHLRTTMFPVELCCCLLFMFTDGKRNASE